ncbi:hypothetical protein P3S68_002664 [Capsicum galapagoense]
MDIGLAVGGAFLSSALNVLFDRLAPHCELLKMFQKQKHDVGLSEKLEDILLGLQIVLSDAENKQASDPLVRKWLNKLQRAVDGAETSWKKSIMREIEIEQLIDCLFSNDANGKKLTVVPIIGMGGLGKTTLAKAAYNDKMVTNHFELKAWTCVSEPYDALRISKELLQEIDSFDSKDDNNLNRLQAKLKEKLNGKRFLIVLDDMWNDNYERWDELRSLFVQGAAGSKIIVTTRKENVARTMGSGAVNVGTLSSEASWALFKRHSLDNRDPKEHPKLEEVGKQIADKCKGLPLALKAIAGILRCKSEVDEWKDILRSEIWEQNLNGILPALMLSYNDLPAHLKQCFYYCAIYPKDYQICKEQVIHLWIANGLVQQLHSGNQYFNELRSRSLFERVSESSERDGGKFLMHDLVNDFAQIASSKLCVRLEECQGSNMLEQSRHLSYSMGLGGDFEKLKSLIKSEQLRTLLPIDIQDLWPKLSKRVLHNILPRLTSLRALSLSCYRNMELPNDLFIKLKLLIFLDLSQTNIKKLPDSICALYNLETLLLSSCYLLEELPLQMEKLINLRHLDISDTSRLKMPLHLRKLKSLQVLMGAKFLLGGPCGWRMKDLGGAHYLYGSLSILALQNVVDRREAQKAKMREKNYVEKLSLEWSESDADNSQTERDILDELHPHSNIKEVEISGYRGTEFPDWLADHSFLKLLVQLSLRNCKDCFSLPSLGQLPSLKFLSIRKMHRITEMTEEFYGYCPKLVGKFPENLCSLKNLRISRCPELNLETPIQVSSLKRFEVWSSPKAGVLFDEAKLEGMKQIEKLLISDFPNLTRFLIPNGTETLDISWCENLEILLSPVACGTQMTSLNIYQCKKLKRLPEGMQELLPSLKELQLWGCPEIESFPDGEFPFNLQLLRIMDCEKLVNGRKELHLQRLPSLSDEEIVGGENWESPCSIQRLVIGNLKTLSSQLLKSLTSLEYLWTEELPQIQSLLEQGLPSSLSKLTIDSCPNLQSLAESAFPSSLSYLTIENCPNLQSLPESAFPSSLSELSIRDCPNLQSLPVKGMPSSLSSLSIYCCPLLEPLLEFDKGEYWPEIAHIPEICIGESYMESECQ